MSLAVSVAEFYVTHFSGYLSLTNTNRVLFSGMSRGDSAKLQEHLDKAIRTASSKISSEFFSRFATGMAEMAAPSFAIRLEAELLKILKPKINPESLDFSKFFWSKENPIPLNKLIYCRDISDPDNSMMWNTVLDIPLPDCRDIIESNLKCLFGEDEGGGRDIWISKYRRNIVRTYMPGQDRFVKDGNNYALNTYVPPPYMKDFILPASPTAPPEEFIDLLKIIIKESSLTDFLHWMRDAVFDRANSIGVLPGSPGLGKGLLIERNLKALVGDSNFHKSTMSFKKEMFNGVWPRKKIGFLDELAVDEEVRDILKNWQNPTATFNRKHIETGDSEIVHASFIVANNYERKIKLEPNDRKFLVLDLNQEPLKNIWSDPRIDRFVELCSKPEYLRACVSFLYSNFKKNSSRRFNKDTEAFHRACHYNRPDWFRRLLIACENCDTVTSGNIKGISYSTVKDEMEHYERVTGIHIGEIGAPLNGAAKWTIKSKIFNASNKEGDLKV